jgi:hypothetical protein
MLASHWRIGPTTIITELSKPFTEFTFCDQSELDNDRVTKPANPILMLYYFQSGTDLAVRRGEGGAEAPLPPLIPCSPPRTPPRIFGMTVFTRRLEVQDELLASLNFHHRSVTVFKHVVITY